MIIWIILGIYLLGFIAAYILFKIDHDKEGNKHNYEGVILKLAFSSISWGILIPLIVGALAWVIVTYVIPKDSKPPKWL